MPSDGSEGRVSRAYRETHTRSQQAAAFTGRMTSRAPTRATTRRIRFRRVRLLSLIVVTAVAAAVVIRASPPSSSSTAPPPRVAVSSHAPSQQPADALGEAGGAVPRGTSVFDEGVPGVANLDPALLASLRRAAEDAAGDGVDFVVDSGWRSPAYQQHLLEEAVARYGSLDEAVRWVATPTTSAHVSGDAIDVGPSQAREWLSAEGGAYGLCPVYDNEPWHYELRPDAAVDGCPPTYPDPTHDPRMRP